MRVLTPAKAATGAWLPKKVILDCYDYGRPDVLNETILIVVM